MKESTWHPRKRHFDITHLITRNSSHLHICLLLWKKTQCKNQRLKPMSYIKFFSFPPCEMLRLLGLRVGISGKPLHKSKQHGTETLKLAWLRSLDFELRWYSLGGWHQY